MVTTQDDLEDYEDDYENQDDNLNNQDTGEEAKDQWDVDHGDLQSRRVPRQL